MSEEKPRTVEEKLGIKPMTVEERLAMIETLQKLVDDLNPCIRVLPRLSPVRDNLFDAQMSLRMAINDAERNW